MTASSYEKLAEMPAVLRLFYASTEEMMERILDQDPQVQLLVQKLVGEETGTEEFYKDALRHVPLDTKYEFRHPHEMELVAALYVLNRIAPGREDQLAKEIVRVGQRAGWAYRIALHKTQRMGAILYEGPVQVSYTLPKAEYPDVTGELPKIPDLPN